MGELLFIGTTEHKLHGNGKISNHVAIPVFKKIGEIFNVDVKSYESPEDYAKSASAHRGAVVILVYNEVSIQSDSYRHGVLRTESIARNEGGASFIVHPSAQGNTIGDKAKAYAAFQKGSVPMPRLVKGDSAPVNVFSNARIGSGNRPIIVREGEMIDSSRYNLELIDTAHEYRGKRYYICLRAMAMGERLTAVYVRARNCDEGERSVHSKDTPVDAGLVNYFYTTIAMPRIHLLHDICRGVYASVGLGFYSHDILPCAKSGKLFMCETGYKFDDAALGNVLKDVRADVIFDDLWTQSSLRSRAYLFFDHFRRLGVW